MYTLIGQNFINMVKSFYPAAKVASGGREVVVRCMKCGDSKDPNHAHLYIKVPQTADEMSLYQCKRCSNKGVVDDMFLRQIGCEDSQVLVDVIKHNNELKNSPKYAALRSMEVFPLRNRFISNQPWNSNKLDYINHRIGSNFTLQDLTRLKIFLNLYDIINQNKLELTRHQMVCDSLNQYFMGFISYDNCYCTMRKTVDTELHQSVNKRYVNYNLVNKFDSTKDFYVIPTRVNIEDPTPVRIHIAEGAFDILSIYYNLNRCNDYQNIYISASGKSYNQALNFILQESGIVNYEIHFYPDADVTDWEFGKRFLPQTRMLPCNIFVHRNGSFGEKDFGVPANRIKDSIRVIYETRI